jgi:2-dehydro-3-deoxyphosphogluconate aldolase/(4S)-4-hydroxy-2-oxoglutarate aldolase
MMATTSSVLATIEEVGVIAVIRSDCADLLVDACHALAGGGVCCEITLSSPGALDAIAVASRELGESALIGAGSVLDSETARAAILAGAQFVVSPILDLGVLQMAHRYGRPAIIGAFTPTEIATASASGADLVKVFPANHFGPRYVADLRGPMPHLRLAPTGGVDLDTIPAWIDAGAVAVGVGSALVRPDLLAARDWPALGELATRYRDAVRSARAS